VLLCIAQLLDYPRRQYLFEKSVKGPFCVAPFIRILLTVVIPWVAGQLENLVTLDERDRPHDERLHLRLMIRCVRSVRACLTPVVRILAMIFYLDAGRVGGCGYIIRGWPFGRVRVQQQAEDGAGGGTDSKAEARLKAALNQTSLKTFEPLDELLEMKMNFIFVCFFAPIMPGGLIPTIIARLLEVRAKATKLFFVRRRHWPDEARLLHDTQNGFARLAAVLAVVWHVGLVLVSYNQHLPSSEWGKTRSVLLWAGISVGVCIVFAIMGLCIDEARSCAASF